MGCLLSSRYIYLVDVYDKRRETNKSGQIKYTWVLKQESVKCTVRTISNDGIRVSGTTERFDEKYANVDWVTIVSKYQFSRSARITNIRKANTGEIIWKEEELAGSPATWFNVNGVMPVLDPFSNIVEWSTLASRAEVQGSGTG